MSRKCHALIVEQIDPAGVDNSPFGRFDLFAVPSANDGVDGAPNVISVPRCSLSTTHLKESRPWAGLSGIWPLYARWARSGEEGLSGSRRRRQGRNRRGAQAHARPARRFLCRAAVLRGGDGGLLLGASLGASTARAGARGQADPGGAREAVRSAQQERRGRRGGDLRGGDAPGPAVRAGALDREPGRAAPIQAVPGNPSSASNRSRSATGSKDSRFAPKAAVIASTLTDASAIFPFLRTPPAEDAPAFEARERAIFARDRRTEAGSGVMSVVMWPCPSPSARVSEKEGPPR